VVEAGAGAGAWWLAAGLFGGLALDSKYTALFLWVGVGLWVFLVPARRRWLRRWEPWAACAIGFGLFLPVLVWNGRHGWAGLVKQSGRVGDWRPVRAVGFLAELLGGQIGLATPLVWGLCTIGLVVAVRRAWRDRDPVWSLLAALSFPPVLVFAQHAIGDRVQGNWPAIIYPALAVAAGGLAVPRRWWVGASVLGFAITGLAYGQAVSGFLPLPGRLDPIAIRLAGWDGLARSVAADAGGAVFVAGNGYTLTSELAWWLPRGLQVVGTDARWGLTTLPVAPITGKPGLLVRDARGMEPPDPALWMDARRIGTVGRPGAPGPDFAVYRVTAVGDLVGLPGR
jgi:hypothetical protein